MCAAPLGFTAEHSGAQRSTEEPLPDAAELRAEAKAWGEATPLATPTPPPPAPRLSAGNSPGIASCAARRAQPPDAGHVDHELVLRVLVRAAAAPLELRGQSLHLRVGNGEGIGAWASRGAAWTAQRGRRGGAS